MNAGGGVCGLSSQHEPVSAVELMLSRDKRCTKTSIEHNTHSHTASRLTSSPTHTPPLSFLPSPPPPHRSDTNEHNVHAKGCWKRTFDKPKSSRLASARHLPPIYGTVTTQDGGSGQRVEGPSVESKLTAFIARYPHCVFMFQPALPRKNAWTRTAIIIGGCLCAKLEHSRSVC